MGLDNIPHNYPCKTQGTAVMKPRQVIASSSGESVYDETDQRIDCQATQECGGCPYKNAYDKSELGGGAVYGMFGTDCWYRGKWGNHILTEAGIDDDDYTFYGDCEDGTYKSPASCLQLADLIDECIGEHSYSAELMTDLKYAEWYLRWAARECDGLDCWY